MSPDDTTACFYCRMPLTVDYEMDHVPVSKRHGGEDTVPACLNCHNLKDRIPANNWPVALMVQALDECGPLGRIFLAKAFAIDADRAYQKRAAA